MRIVLIRVLAALAFLLAATTVLGQSVTRGPYLQQQTDGGIIIRWRTDVATDSVVRYGPDSASLFTSASVGGSRTDHRIALTGLSPQTRYYYSVGDSLGPLAGDASYHFYTAPVIGTPTATRFWAIGDSGTAVTHPGLAASVRDAFKNYSENSPADFMLMLGDNAYNDGTDSEYQSTVFDVYPELFRQIPVWSTLGNHDGHSADSATQTGPYYDIFELPKAAEAGGYPSGTEAYYSFDYGDVHFVCLDSYDSPRGVNGSMMTWLESDLAENDKTWVIAYWHHPPYSKGSHNSDSSGEVQMTEMRENFLPVLEAWGVDLVLTGHSHSYERSFLLDGHYGLSGTLDLSNPSVNVLDWGDGDEAGNGAYEKSNVIAAENEGAVYIVAGSSGKVSTATLNHPAMYVGLNNLGSMVVDVAGNRLDAVFIDENGSVRDRFNILKSPDLSAPLIVSAWAEDGNHVMVDFSEPLDTASAGLGANYSVTGLSISGVELMADNRTVRLTVDTMTPGSSYTVTVNNVMDEAGNTILPNSSFSFDYILQVTQSFQNGVAPAPDYAGTSDSFIREASANTNYGSDLTLQVDGDEPAGTTTDMNILIRWDVTDIPASAIVESARIRLNTLNEGGPYSCFALSRDWNPAEVNWNQAAAGNPWATPGAEGASDRAGLPLCTVNASTTGPISIELNEDGIAMVQSWVDGPGDNHGLIIADSATTNGADFDSSESVTPSSRPRLEITFTMPSIPDAPGGLGASAYSADQIDLNWVDNSANEDGFIVERSPNGSNSWVEIAALGADVTAFSDSALGANTTGYYRVYAYNVNGNSGYSNVANATTFAVPRTIQFSGRSWTVKSSASPVGPGPNYFGSTRDDVWVDSSGYLHMKVMFRDGNWHSSEVIGNDVLGYGTYTFTLGSRVDLLDRNIVVGLFTWDTSAPEFNYREIDIEFSRWGDPVADNSQYVVQPWDTAGNTLRWNTVLTGTTSTHAFEWRPDRVAFSSHQGSPPGAVIQEWTYSGADVPPEGATSGNARINFWLMGGSAPFDGQEAELVVRSFEFTPLPDNSPPVAGFTPNCTNLDCTFTDTSSDSDGTLVSWAWDFGDSSSSTAQNPVHSFATDGSYTVELTVTDNEGATDVTSAQVTVSTPPPFTDVVVNADLSGSGTVSGLYTATHTDDAITQSIRERESGGRKPSRYSYLTHTWQADLPANVMATVHINAWSGGSSDDDFIFSWSTDNNTFTELFTVSSTSPANEQSATIPEVVVGPIYIRVEDSDQTPGNNSLDTVFIDHLYIRVESGGGNPPTAPAAPTGLAASPNGSGSVNLSWGDNSDDELGFAIERSTDNVNFESAGSTGANVTTFADSGLTPETSYWYRVNAFNAGGNSSFSNTATATTDAAPAISLVLNGYKIKGNHTVDLNWTGTTTATVDIFRNGALVATVADTGSYTDATSNKGGGTYDYQVCEAGTANCSDIGTVTF